jgi:hypothetical protein
MRLKGYWDSNRRHNLRLIRGSKENSDIGKTDGG